MDQTLQQQLLAQLDDIQTPEAITWWPPAIGWWVLALLFVLLIVTVVKRVVERRQTQHYRHDALELLDIAFKDWQQTQNSAEYLSQSSAILKRVCYHLSQPKFAGLTHQEPQPAATTGKLWIDVLNSYTQTPLSNECEFALTVDCFRASPISDIQLIHTELSGWISDHRRPTHA